MKKVILISAAVFAYCILQTANCFSQGTAINATGVPADNSAMLDVSSTSKGTLITRMTSGQRNAILSPAEGLLIYNTTTQCYEGYNSSIPQWVSFGCIGCQLPGTFASNAASNIAQTSFSANWSTSAGATDYYIDVSTASNFTSFAGIYNNLNVGNVFTAGITGLTCNTTYYYRVRAGNSCGTTANSNTVTATTSSCWTCGDAITDSRDNRSYTTVLIGSQCWLAKNMNIGVKINSNISSDNQTDNGVIEKYCYNNDTNNCTVYGGLYQWAEMVQYLNGAGNGNSWNPVPTGNVQGICPSGWHIPSDAEYCTLENTVEPGTDPGCNQINWRGSATGTKMKVSSGYSPAWDGNNSSGFTAVPGGNRKSSDGGFMELGVDEPFWTATESGASTAIMRYLYSGYSGSNRLETFCQKGNGFAVRCLKD